MYGFSCFIDTGCSKCKDLAGSGQSVLLANATMNYETEREPVLATALGPPLCPSRGTRPLACPSRSARPRKCHNLTLNYMLISLFL